MEEDQFVKFLTEHPENYEWAEGEWNGSAGIFVKNKQFETETHFTNDAIEKHDLDLLVAKTHHGKNVDHITRVTGFFSKVSSWNKGKRGELKDRYRSEEEV